MKKKIVVTSLLLLVVIVASARPLGRLYTDKILDNREHYIACNNLPTIAEVEKVMFAHKTELELLVKTISKDYVDVGVTPQVAWEATPPELTDKFSDGRSSFSITWGEQECRGTGRGDIKAWYMKHKDRELIEKTWGNTFYGVPYRGQNI